MRGRGCTSLSLPLTIPSPLSVCVYGRPPIPSPSSPPSLSRQVCVAVLLDNFVNASARDEEKARLRKIEEAKSFKVGED